jgi:hypothetical protein
MTTTQPLYDLCVAAVATEAGDAARRPWMRDHGRVTAALETGGVVLRIEDVVRTALLAGQGDPHGPPQRRGPCEDNWSAEERF